MIAVRNTSEYYIFLDLPPGNGMFFGGREREIERERERERETRWKVRVSVARLLDVHSCISPLAGPWLWIADTAPPAGTVRHAV